jgi:hypothetical protein
MYGKPNSDELIWGIKVVIAKKREDPSLGVELGKSLNKWKQLPLEDDILESVCGVKVLEK